MLLIINVNNFNLLTAALSGPAIAQLQNEIKSRILQTLPPDIQLGMFSENRFIAFLPNHGHMEQRDQLFKLQQLQETLTHYYTVKDQQITCTFRQGVSFFPQHGTHIEQLIDRAFSVMGNAKKTPAAGILQSTAPTSISSSVKTCVSSAPFITACATMSLSWHSNPSTTLTRKPLKALKFCCAGIQAS